MAGPTHLGGCLCLNVQKQDTLATGKPGDVSKWHRRDNSESYEYRRRERDRLPRQRSPSAEGGTMERRGVQRQHGRLPASNGYGPSAAANMTANVVSSLPSRVAVRLTVPSSPVAEIKVNSVAPLCVVDSLATVKSLSANAPR